MNGLSHKQARRYIHANLDGLLNDAQRLALETHLAGCEACRIESESFSTLTTRLQSEFHERWDAQDGPSQNVITNVQSQTRRIAMSNKVSFGLRALAGIAALIVLGFGMNILISQLRNFSVASNSTAIPDNNMPVNSENANKRLLAFTKMENGNTEIYTIHADGSGLTNITNNPAYDSKPFWSPDGKHIAFESNRSGLPQVYVMDANGSNITQITDDEDAYSLPMNVNDGGSNPWSPDGSKLLFLQQNPSDGTWTLSSISITGKNKRSIATGKIQLNGISWSPDGSHIGFILNGSQSTNENDFVPEIYVANTDGSVPWRATEFLKQNEQFSDNGFTWSPDGQAIIFEAFWQTTNPEWAIYEASMDNRSINKKYSTNSLLNEWHDGIAVITASGGVFNWLNMDKISGTLNPYQNCKQADTTRSGSFIQPSPGGNWVTASYCANRDLWFYWANANGTETKQLLNSPIFAKENVLSEITWSPDDKFIAVTMQSSNFNDLYILNLEKSLSDSSIQPLKIETVYFDGPSWQPVIPEEIVVEETTQTPLYDGLIAFTSSAKNGNLDIFTMHADGSGLTNITDNPAQDVSPSWSPDGKRIAFESDRNGFRQIFLMDVDGTDLVLLNENKDKADQWIGEPYDLGLNIWSPDGNKLIFYEVAPGDEDGMLYVIDADGENKKPLVYKKGKYASPSWSPDGKHIAFITIENNMARIYITDANGSTLTNVTKALPSDETLYPRRYSWSRDGQSISFVASNWDYLLGRGYGTTSNYKWTAYEANLNDNSLIVNASANSQMGGYWDGTYFLSGSAVISSSPEYKWVRSDGTSTTINPIEKCERVVDDNTGDYVTGYSSFKQSYNGNVVIGAYCPNGDKWLFLANSKGRIIPLLNSPIHIQSAPKNAMNLWAPPDFVWSSNDEYIAFNLFSAGKTDMYIVNVKDAQKNPSHQPFHMTIGNVSLHYSPIWQPVP
ncbi:MAG: PD40 domain-containing protein [Anaerolineales bacterium]|nr:PD40 domain-containing protein [Anaerolineales bacterium]